MRQFRILLLLMGLLLFSGCGWEEAEKENGGYATEPGYTFTDDLGREVCVNGHERVAALIGSFADIWMLSGGSVTAAANDSFTSLGLDLGEEVVNLGSIQEPDVERLLASRPDLVLASANTAADLALLDLLEEAGVTVACFSVSGFEEYLHMLYICTQITGRADLYEKNGLEVKAQIDKAKERMDGSAPTVLFLRASAGGVKAKGSSGNVGGEMLADLGCVNIADSGEGLLDELSMEAIIAADPEFIFITTQGTDTEATQRTVYQQLFENPAWEKLTAVQQGKCYMLEKRLYNLKPNAKWGEAYEKLAGLLYPETAKEAE